MSALSSGTSTRSPIEVGLTAGRVARGDQGLDRDRPHHRRQAAGVHPLAAARLSMLVDASNTTRPKAPRSRPSRSVLRPGRPARLRREHRRAGRRRPDVGLRARARSTANRSPARSSTSGKRRQPAVPGAGSRRAGGAPARPLHDARGRQLAFLAVRPVPYTIPDDGPVGRMLAIPAATRGGPPTSTYRVARPATAR